MSLVIVSDESGCTGPSYVKGASDSYVISMCCFPTLNDLRAFVNLAKSLSPRYLGSTLRKWSGLNSATKNNPEALAGFAQELFSAINKDHAVVLGLFLMNKKEIESGRYLKREDKKRIKFESDRGYELAFKRFFPFVKSFHFHAGGYRSGSEPNVTWFIDINNNEFQSSQNEKIFQLAANNSVNLTGPTFVQKNDPQNYYAANAIKIVDILAGVAANSFNRYLDDNGHCQESSCLNSTSCPNPWIVPWKVLCHNASGIQITHNGSRVWDWHGLFYSPIGLRRRHGRFLGIDPFIR